MVFSIAVIYPSASAEGNVPNWVKNNAGWWATDAISQTEFLNAIEFLINNQIIKVSTYYSSGESEQIPVWVKNTAGWWATDAISEGEFVNAIEFLINIGIINIANTNCENDLQEYFPNDSESILKVCTEHNSKEFLELTPYATEYDFNSHGFIGPEFSEIKSPNTYRIFMIGGSTMIGSGNNSPETAIPGILQKIYDQQNLGMNIEVINAGISGGNVKSEYELIKNKIFNLDPDLILVYNGWNDISADYPVPLMRDTTSTLCNDGKSKNVDVIITLQPIAGFGDKVLTQQEMVNSLTGEDHNGFQLIQARSTYDFYARELSSLGNCEVYDLRDVFDDVSGPIYWDQGHIGETGNLLLAEKFFELSSKKVANDIQPINMFHDIISKYNSPEITSYLLTKLDVRFDDTIMQSAEEWGASDDNRQRQGSYFYLKYKLGGSENILTGKDLRSVDLNSIDLYGGELFAQYRSSTTYDADLTGANLSGQDLRHIDFSNIMIRGADLSNTNLDDQNFSGVDLRGVNFSNASIENGNFIDAKFSKIIQADFGCIDNIGEDFVKLVDCGHQIAKNELMKTDFSGSNLNGVKFGSTTSDFQVIQLVDFSDADLTNSNFDTVGIWHSNFENAILDNIKMKNFGMGYADFSNVKMKNFHMSEFVMVSTSFKNADMTNGTIDLFNAEMVKLDFTDTDFQNTHIFSQIRIDGQPTLLCINNSVCN